jgi:transcription elongation GreA/GreB family factor
VANALQVASTVRQLSLLTSAGDPLAFLSTVASLAQDPLRINEVATRAAALFADLSKLLTPELYSAEILHEVSFQKLAEVLARDESVLHAAIRVCCDFGISSDKNLSDVSERLDELISLRRDWDVVKACVGMPNFLLVPMDQVYSYPLEPLLHSIRYWNEWTSLPEARAFDSWLLNQKMAERLHALSNYLLKVYTLYQEWKSEILNLNAYGEVEPGSVFDSGAEKQFLDDVIVTTETALSNIDVLLQWCDYQRINNRLGKLISNKVLQFIRNNHLDGEQAKAYVEACFFSQRLSSMMKKYPELQRFDRIEHEKYRARFQEADRKLHSIWPDEIDSDLEDAPVPQGRAEGRVTNYTELTLIRHELNKQKRHVPVRELIKRAPETLFSLMPCWMMGPAAVAQFLPQTLDLFDVVVMDEASQIRPEDALGALARAHQIVIVGDQKQMPPTNMFVSSVSADGLDNDGDAQPADLTSILESLTGYCCEEMLRWHYRSQHESLIMFSNHHFYEKQLIIPPACERAGKSGVSWHYVPDGTFSGGTNPIEADVVVKYIVSHVYEESQKPLGRQASIGVVAMNMAQQAVIEDLFEKLLSTDRKIQAAYERFQPSEKLFIRNLESVQGDERDVIIISFTYGPDPVARRVYQRFGPVNSTGGWRRLNVLFTRAKHRIIAISSMRSSDIQLGNGATAASGVPALKGYLEYAENGQIPDFGEATDRPPDSPFEESVASVLWRLGLKPVFQVGVAGFRIDIGVEEPDNPGTYICGIECDGAPYHTDPVARDRDRLREEILVARGWKIYRIWSTAWYRNRKSEVERLEKFLASVVAEASKRPKKKIPPTNGAEHQPKKAGKHVSEISTREIPAETFLTDAKQEILSRRDVVEVGDTVIYCEDDDETPVEVMITTGKSNVDFGIINSATPIARGLLGASPGERIAVNLPASRLSLLVLKVLKKA